MAWFPNFVCKIRGHDLKLIETQTRKRKFQKKPWERNSFTVFEVLECRRCNSIIERTVFFIKKRGFHDQ